MKIKKLIAIASLALSGIVAYYSVPAIKNAWTATPPASESPAPAPQNPAPKKETPAEAPPPQTAPDEKAIRLAELESEFKALESDKPGILAQARGNEFCNAYGRLEKYEKLVSDVEKAALETGDLESRLASAAKAAGRRASSLAYAQMKAAKKLTCGESEDSNEADFIEEVAKLFDQYGSESEKFEPAVIRGAIIRTFKPGIDKALAELALNPESAEAQESLVRLIQSAQQSHWHPTLQELGVSVAKKI